jgi:hypothetical protein
MQTTFHSIIYPLRTRGVVEGLIRRLRPHFQRACATKETDGNVTSPDLLHFLRRNIAVMAALQDVSGRDRLLVDLLEVHFEASDAAEQLSTAERAVAAADVAA